MLIGAVVIGALAAYYFGLQAGVWAAAITVGLLVAAMVPGLSMYAYAILAVGVGVLFWFGPRLKRPNSAAGVVMMGQKAARRYYDKLRKKL